jgi:hypothetical protein
MSASFQIPLDAPFVNIGNIREGTLPPDLETAYRSVFWCGYVSNLILESASSAYPAVALVGRWIREIKFSFVAPVADEIAIAREAKQPICCDGMTAATYHDFGVNHAWDLCVKIDRAVCRAAMLPRVTTVTEPPWGILYAKHWDAALQAVAAVPRLGVEFFAALKLEAIWASERRKRLISCTPPLPAAATQPSEKDRAPLATEEREAVTAAFLRDNPDATIKAVSDATGASVGAINKTDAWRAEMARRKANRPPRQPRVHQLRADGEASILADHRAPVDAAVKREEDDAAWRRIVESADPQHRGVLNGMNEQARSGLIKYSLENGAEETKTMVELAAGQAADLASERRSPRRQ